MKGLGILIIAFILIWTPYVFASGFYLYNQDIKAQAQASAFTAQADNPSAVYYNPAGMSQLDGTQVSANGRFVRLETEYESTLGATEDMQAEWAVVPAAYITSDLATEKWTFGLGLFAPFGLSTSWSDTGLFKYIATDTAFNMVDINPSVAYQLLPELSVGLGVDYYNVYSYTSELKQNLLIADADVELDVDGDGWGFNLGALWKPHEQHSFGLTYRSRVDIEFSGDFTVDNIPIILGLPASISSNVTADLTLPSIVSGGYAFRPTDKLKLEADIYWVEWSTLDKVEIINDDTGILLSSTDKNWEDTWVFAIGGEYYLKEDLALRAGYFFAENAIPEGTFDPVVPDNDLHAFSVGLGYTIDRFTIDIAYTLGIYEERDIDNNIGAAVGATVDGNYDSLIHIIGVGVGYRF